MAGVRRASGLRMVKGKRMAAACEGGPPLFFGQRLLKRPRPSQVDSENEFVGCERKTGRRVEGNIFIAAQQP